MAASYTVCRRSVGLPRCSLVNSPREAIDPPLPRPRSQSVGPLFMARRRRLGLLLYVRLRVCVCLRTRVSSKYKRYAGLPQLFSALEIQPIVSGHRSDTCTITQAMQDTHTAYCDTLDVDVPCHVAGICSAVTRERTAPDNTLEAVTSE